MQQIIREGNIVKIIDEEIIDISNLENLKQQLALTIDELNNKIVSLNNMQVDELLSSIIAKEVYSLEIQRNSFIDEIKNIDYKLEQFSEK